MIVNMTKVFKNVGHSLVTKVYVWKCSTQPMLKGEYLMLVSLKCSLKFFRSVNCDMRNWGQNCHGFHMYEFLSHICWAPDSDWSQVSILRIVSFDLDPKLMARITADIYKYLFWFVSNFWYPVVFRKMLRNGIIFHWTIIHSKIFYYNWPQ